MDPTRISLSLISHTKVCSTNDSISIQIIFCRVELLNSQLKACGK